MINKEFKKRFYSSIILFPLSIFFIIEGSFIFTFFLSICFLVAFYEWIKMTKKKQYFILGTFFLIFSYYCTLQFRINSNENYNIFMFVFLICISTDIGGYVFGNFFKGPKLTKISPKKTYAGMIGGYLLSIIFAKIYFDYLGYNMEFLFTTQFVIIVILISSVSQLGDIVISYFKRLSKVKDTGKIIPGHGGLLDRIDGMIFAFPFSYLIFAINKFSII